MKKKLISLLLVVAVMVTSVSIGFGSLSALAASAGGGVESINAFSLTSAGDAIGTEFKTSITVKSKVAGYQIKINSITATIRYTADETNALTTVYVNGAAGAVCDTKGRSFDVTGTLDSGLAGIIRYECNYDLLDSNSAVVYAGMTGLGYSPVSANGEQTGAIGTYQTVEPSDPGSGYGFHSFAQINSLYVDPTTFTLNCVTETEDNDGTHFGRGGEEYTMSLSGEYPSTVSVQNIKWEGCKQYKNSSVSIDWFKLTTPPSGYYDFDIIYNGSKYYDVVMYCRNSTDQQNAAKKMNEYLNLGLEKSYYTTNADGVDTWEAYVKELDKVAHAALAIPGPNVSYRMACQNASAAATASALETAKNNLVQAPADYSGAWDAYYYFAGNTEYNESYTGVQNETVPVKTYVEGGTATGTEYVKKYSQASIDRVHNYINTVVAVDMERKKCDQKIVDGYEAGIREEIANLAYADAVYTHLDIAIAELETINSKLYTTDSWSEYQSAVTAADNLSDELKTDSQDTINKALEAIVVAKNGLDYVDADTTKLKEQIEVANDHFEAYRVHQLFFTTAEGFADIWNLFETRYDAAVAVKGYKIDKQGEVDQAAADLEEVNKALEYYRALDLTELNEVLKLTPEYPEGKYTPESYNLWSSLRVEGYTFRRLAASDYSGSDRKTYADRNEMESLIDAIRDAYEHLEKVKADFTELDEVIAKIPSERELAKYKDEIVQPIKDLLATVDYGKTFDQQDDVDNLVLALEAAIANLTEENYKDADYSKVDEEIAKKDTLDENVYTDDSWQNLLDAIDAVEYGKKIDKQAEVDAMAEAIRTAIKDLKYILADYKAVEDAIARAETYNKDLYANYGRVQDLIDNYDKNITIDRQDEVDAIAAAIHEALDNLELAAADYTEVNKAIAEAKKHEPFSRYTKDSVDNLNNAISAVDPTLTKDRQDEVDAMAERIYAAIEALDPLPADYTDINLAIDYANSYKKENYQNYDIVETAIGAINWDLNCLQTEEMAAQLQAIYDAVDALKLLPADYSKVIEAINNARAKYVNSEFPYTQDSIDALEAVIGPIEEEAYGPDEGKITIDKKQEVELYVTQINNAAAGLKYEKANYDELNEQLAIYRALERAYYDSLSDLDAYVTAIDMNITIDRQKEVDTYASELKAMLEGLSYAPADYSAVDSAIRTFETMNKDYFEPDDVQYVQDVIDTVVVRGYTKDKQAEVKKMADDINEAIEELKNKMKKADLTALNKAKADAQAKYDEMYVSKYEIDQTTWRSLQNLIIKANNYYDENTTIDNQEEVDQITQQIIQATENLQFIFEIDFEETKLIIDEENGYIYGFEEGAFAEDAIELIKFVGPAEIKIIETSGYFGTGTIIQFISTKDQSILASYTVLVFGDANGDAVVDMFDVAYTAQIVNFEQTPSEVDIKALDFDGSGTIDANELTTLISIANMECTIAQDGSMMID